MQRPIYKGRIFYENFSLFPGCYDSDCDSGEDCEKETEESWCDHRHYHDSGYERKKLGEISKIYDISEKVAKAMLKNEKEYYMLKVFKILCVNQVFKHQEIVNFLALYNFPGYKYKEIEVVLKKEDEDGNDSFYYNRYILP
jgi:hypothetical protein